MATIDLRLPDLSGLTQAEQMKQMQSYLYQLVEKLNWALNLTNEGKSGNYTNIVRSGQNGGKTAEIDTQKVFSDIKAMIIKSADIVAAYEEKMQLDFNGIYEAKSDADTFKQTVTTTLNLTPKKAEMVSEINEAINKYSETINAYIRFGLLEGSTIYGVEIGERVGQGEQETFNRYARFLPDGVYFYTPYQSTPIAYFSTDKMYITKAEVTGDLKIGGYKLSSSGGLTFRWVGGSS